ncbi:protein kinase family protein [Thalassospira tepidiphila]|uniref:Protein kinase domain-containing protein n=2 Tax=Thalassospira tepidiphila TaxID=393657 RepID=A0A853L4V9_9PROT|nr:protein kinase family protein [Thalassospira tepidiphila]NJB73640.1 serine/threonine-protein kinase [Thalassospira tepidiphila]OAZ12174.1 hypothetical protein TH4_03680 [Thalassospira tepidiphila MCCC 1A03514]
MKTSRVKELIEFNRPQKYKFVKSLGNGACGETILMRDEEMGIDLVAKKYKPIIEKRKNPDLFRELLDRFRREAKILFQINHLNIVRVYSYFDYNESDTSYITMEYIQGDNIIKHIKSNPTRIGAIFEKTINGFSYLEEKKILHRDIRPDNILIDINGEPKIIDFGFGKESSGLETNIDKSISLNWWCEKPLEFNKGQYDTRTEIYFVGQLFAKAANDAHISEYDYAKIIAEMCDLNAEKRPKSFSDIKLEIAKTEYAETEFTDEEIQTYRLFSESLCEAISEIGTSSKYVTDTTEIIEGLEEVYKKNMLEERIHAPEKIIGIFVEGGFKFWKNEVFYTSTLEVFLKFLRKLSTEKQWLVLANLTSRLDGIKRYQEKNAGWDDEIPF